MTQLLSNFGDSKFIPDDKYIDATDKFRITQPQSLIDTDFEYGVQGTKWENLSLINNRPAFFSNQVPIANITSISLPINSRTVTVTTSSAHGVTVNTPIFVQDSFLAIANGNFIVETVPTSTTFTFTAESVNITSIAQLLDTNKTVIYSGVPYVSAKVGGAPTITTTGTDFRVVVQTTIPHGFALGNDFCITGITGTNAPNGNFTVATILSPTQFVYFAHPSTGIPAISTSLNTTNAAVYGRPQSQFLHRPFDGGVIFSPHASSNHVASIRQTRRYFRYQSGKAIQMSSGTTLRPYYTIDSITSSGTQVTVQTREPHNLQPGSVVTVEGARESGYNGTWIVNGAVTANKFYYTAFSTPSAPIATGEYKASVVSWNGAVNRLGMFDFQNGIFFEYDGERIYIVRRSATYQTSGRVTVTQGSASVIQTGSEFPSNFTSQYKPGDSVVIRGQTYRINDVYSDTEMIISPAYRGSSAQNVIMSKIVETRVPQSEWNIDTCDGTGPSGFLLDLTKMQMFYIDYTWYGAGYVRWGLRGIDGQVFYVHKMLNNNVNTEAYMRSGNLPARYEVTTTPAITILGASLSNSDTTMTVESTEGFPSSGTLYIRDASKAEFVSYSSITPTQFVGLTRATTGSSVNGVATTWALGSVSGTVANATGLQVGQRVYGTANPSPIQNGTYVTRIQGNTVFLNYAPTSANPNMIFAPMGQSIPQSFTYSATAPVTVEQAYNTYAPFLSHWGTSVIMEGRFDDDKSLIFTYGQSTPVNIGANSQRALFSIRLAPSVDTGISGPFGARELINRMQLKLDSIGLTSSNSNVNLLISAVLNGRVTTTGGSTPLANLQWTNPVGGVSDAVTSSLSQVLDYSQYSSTTILGGETVAGYFVQGTSALDLRNVRDLGNSILGGGSATGTTEFYPDGPDILTIVVRNVSSTGTTVNGRISWTEAQA